MYMVYLVMQDLTALSVLLHLHLANQELIVQVNQMQLSFVQLVIIVLRDLLIIRLDLAISVISAQKVVLHL